MRKLIGLILVVFTAMVFAYTPPADKLPVVNDAIARMTTMIVGGGVPSAECSWETIWDATSQCDGSVGNTSWYPNIRGVILGSEISAGTNTTLRFTFTARSDASSNNFAPTCVSVGERTGSDDDAVSLTEILFSAGSGFTISTDNGEIVSDELSFTMSSGTDYVFQAYDSGGILSAAWTDSGATDYSYNSGTNDCSTAAGGNHHTSTACVGLRLIEACN